MTGRHVEAAEALAIGLADKVIADDDLLAVAMEDAAKFAAGPTVAYAAVKDAVRNGFDRTLDEGLAIEADAFADCFRSEDAKIGVAAFLAKERPDFVGR